MVPRLAHASAIVGDCALIESCRVVRLTGIPHHQPGERGLLRQGGLEAADDVDADAFFATAMDRPELTEQRERRPIVRRTDGETAKAVRHDADDFGRDPVDEHAAAQHRRVTRELPVPTLVTEHHHRLPLGPLIVAGEQRPSQRGLDAEDLEEVAGNQRAGHHPAIDAAVEIGQLRIGVGKDVRLAP